MTTIFINVPGIELQDEYKNAIKRLGYENIHFEIRHFVGRSEELIRQVKSDVVIARGLGAMDIREKLPQVHVVEIETTVYDLYQAVMECKSKYGAKKIGIISTDTFLCNIDVLKEMTGAVLSLYSIRQETDIVEALEDGLFSGVDAFVGGRTAFVMCRDRGIPFTSLRVGREAVEHSIAEAVSAVRILEHERAKTTLMEKLLDSTRDSIVAIDATGCVTQVNRQARALFQLTGEIIGTPIKNFFPESEWEKHSKDSRSSEWVVKIGGRLCMVQSTPVLVKGECCGLLYAIQNSEQIQKAENRIRNELSKKGLVAKYHFTDILGESRQIRQNIQDACKYSRVDSNVLIIGETGTGKELFAHSIHNASGRNAEPFVAVNCAALPESLLESELFGYVEGAFSGAARGGKAGLFELAHKGTIFLDEIGELPLPLQAKLLRVLQEKEIRRIGDDKIISVDVRVISATNIKIEERVKNGDFRPDLYYRLNLLDIRLYPLRQRPEDIPILANHFIENIISAMRPDVRGITPEALAILQTYVWRGNVRELRNICEKLVVLCESDLIGADDVKDLHLEEEAEESHPETLADAEQEIRFLIEKMGMKKGELAKQMGISRSTLWRQLNKKTSS